MAHYPWSIYRVRANQGALCIVLRLQVRELVRYTRQRAADESATPALSYSVATVRRVAAAGMGDRACVDLACLLQVGVGAAAP